MRKIKENDAADCPHQSMRDIQKTVNATDKSSFKPIFAASPHQRDAAGGAVSLPSQDVYALETITLADTSKVKQAAIHIGMKLLPLAPGAKTQWEGIVGQIITRLGSLNAQTVVTFYGAAYERMLGIRSLRGTSGDISKWALTGPMKRSALGGGTQVRMPLATVKGWLPTLMGTSSSTSVPSGMKLRNTWKGVFFRVT